MFTTSMHVFDEYAVKKSYILCSITNLKTYLKMDEEYFKDGTQNENLDEWDLHLDAEFEQEMKIAVTEVNG